MKKLFLTTVATIALATAGALAAEQSAKDHPGTKAGTELKGHAGGSPAGGAGPAMRSGADVNAGSELKSGKGSKAGGDVKGSAGTRIKNESTESGVSAKSGADRHQKADTHQKSGAQMKSSDRAQNHSETTGAAPSGGGTVNLTSTQKAKIRTTVIQTAKAPKVERSEINFSLNIGTAVPRNFRLVAVPPTLVEIHPAWRGYLYFVVAYEIIIVHPRTHEIVAIVTV